MTNPVSAIAQIRSQDETKILGYLYLDQISAQNTHIYGTLEGLPPGEHGFHIHEKGNPKDCCSNLGGHYNPYHQPHGDRCRPQRHVGDLGNIMVASDGTVNIDLTDNLVRLFGPTSVMGRTFVIHSDKDDCGMGGNAGSVKNGNSGQMIAYGLIGYR